MYWVNLIIFSAYTSFWFYFLDYPLEVFIRKTVFSYKNLSSEEFIIALRFAFVFFLVNVLIKIRKGYTSLTSFFCKSKDKTTDDISLTKTEEDRYKIDFTIDKKQGSILIQKSTEYDSIEGIYTDDYNNCVTSEVKPFFTFYQDMVRPRDINKIYNREDASLIITYKNKEERTVITDNQVYQRSYMEDYIPEESKTSLDETQHNQMSEL